jgi:hypothetical protein
MNERIKQLAEQAGLQPYYKDQDSSFERFAELVRQDEREANAKLCDEEADQSGSDHEAGGMYWCAEAIRARGNHEQN